LIAADNYSDCPAAAAELPHIDAFSPGVEPIVALEPDLVIVFYDPGGLVDALSAAGAPAIVLEAPASIEGLLEQTELLGKITGHAEDAAELASLMRQEIDAITALTATAEPPTVFHEVDNTYFTAGPGSFTGDLYEALGAENIAAATGEAYPQMTAEAIIAADPEVIILADEDAGESPETVAARPGWSGISAVKNGRVRVVDPDIVSRPGPRLVEALATLARYLYPDVFE
jgi:iron complex transport system substrate-binding protein